MPLSQSDGMKTHQWCLIPLGSHRCRYPPPGTPRPASGPTASGRLWGTHCPCSRSAGAWSIAWGRCCPPGVSGAHSHQDAPEIKAPIVRISAMYQIFERTLCAGSGSQETWSYPEKCVQSLPQDLALGRKCSCDCPAHPPIIR